MGDPETDGKGGYGDDGWERDEYKFKQRMENGFKDRPFCFPASTQILTPSGTRDISSFKSGDSILSWDADIGALQDEKVIKLKCHSASPLVSIAFENGTSLPVTSRHLFLTACGWKRPLKLRPGNTLRKVYPHVVDLVVTSVSKLPERVPVFNLVTTGSHNFIAEGMPAHNFSYWRRTRTLWHQLFIDPRYMTHTEEASTASLV